LQVIWAILEAISRGGNYVLNIPLTPEGELDPGGRRTLEDMAAWMAAHGEGVHDTEVRVVAGRAAAAEHLIIKFACRIPRAARTATKGCRTAAAHTPVIATSLRSI
jgi:alpha-L-fucosidase